MSDDNELELDRNGDSLDGAWMSDQKWDEVSEGHLLLSGWSDITDDIEYCIECLQPLDSNGYCFDKNCGQHPSNFLPWEAI